MLQRTLNLGILAHVDAGKTTLTERLLYEAGAIERIGSVDAGTTQTDSLALERQRGITIRSAVASFALDDLHVNLIDTPGHPDFIAEVERVLGVLDGAVLVISAVEGVQPQTRILFRALQRLGIPTLFFVNKTDRVGADETRVLHDVAARLTAAATPASDPELPELLAEHDDGFAAAYLDGELTEQRVRDTLAAQTKRALVHPVFFGSAITGAGIAELTAGIGELLPASTGDPDGPLAATVFKIERGTSGEKIAYARAFSGTIHTRDRVHFGDGLEAKVTALALFDRGDAARRPSVSAGGVAKLWGLAGIQVGDGIGEAAADTARQFPPPTLQSVVVAHDREALRNALAQLAEQDPLISVRQDDGRHELSVSLYGEVQKEVIQATLASDYGLDVTFRDTTPICVERPAGTGEAIELLHAESNPFDASMALRIEPAPDEAGVRFRMDVDPRTTPLYLYKTFESFTEHMRDYVRDALQQGLCGWQVTDCIVTMTDCTYSLADGPPSRRGPLSKAADFRKLTPLVLRHALERAGTVVCEPIVRASIETPSETVGAVLAALARLGASSVEAPSLRGSLATIDGVLSAERAQELRRQLAGLTGGEGVVDTTFAGHRPASGT
ncbi:MAG: GTP-binding protein [Gaiellaceae bacterium]